MRFLAWLRRFFLLPSKPLPHKERAREYEWRRVNGSVYKGPVAALDACEFWLRSHALGWVVETTPPPLDAPKPKPGPDGSLGLYVVGTGERVPIEGTVGVRARIHGGGSEWRPFRGVSP